jgi:hypothetical protein
VEGGETGGQTEWNRGEDDHEGNSHADAGVGVVATRVVGEPDYEGGDYDADVVDGVADYVEHDGEETEFSRGKEPGGLGNFMAVVFVVFVECLFWD